MGVKRLDFESGAIGLREQRDRAIRHGSIHVHEQHLNPCGTLLHACGDFSHTFGQRLLLSEMEKRQFESSLLH
jgi:hypothetical protein